MAVAVVAAAAVSGLSSGSADAGAIPAWRLLELPELPGTTSSAALVVADDGTAFGNVYFGNRPGGGPEALPVKWPPGGGIVELPTVSDTTTTVAGIDENGTVVGQAVDTDGVTRAVLWDRERVVVLPSLGGRFSFVGAANRAGTHVGASADLDGKSRAVRWERPGRITELDSLPGSVSSSASDIDDTGLVTGGADLEPGQSRAVTWDRHGRITVLPDLGGRLNWAETISRSGKILGIADRPDQASCDCHNTVYWNRSGQLTDLGQPFGTKSTVPAGMNAAGVIVATAAFEVPSTVTHVIRWDRHDHPTDLGTLPGGSRSLARAINDHGAIIGQAETAGRAEHAAFWDPAGRVSDLGAIPGADYSAAIGMNDHDVVVGLAQDPQTWAGRAVEWRRW
ncbi:putative HAF family extracellular repeat protein [Amycolatopsis lexingtonensis]|uniref:HAF family extracellular repeat protein n=1 Tax=Amycolatopsis lexingtonensis TaxID=218822 RepID=A0ABR9HQK8_9PSEU|nr:hypothetical protein [Amycolatopsis lexingtonensis]MBE1493209.1 putative HAF family extracellular repeat protein [Amycolatopsis lexingtonensis]